MKRNSNYDYYNVPQIDTLSDLVSLRYDSSATAFEWLEDGAKVSRSYSDVYRDVHSLASFFAKNYKNKNIAVIGENSYSWIIYALAISISGNVCVAIDKDYDLDEIKMRLRQCDVVGVCYSDNYNHELAKLRKDLYSFEDIDQYIDKGSKLKKVSKVKPNQAAMIYLTSGTTGYSKAVVLTHKNIAANVYGAASLFNPYGGACSFLPYHHAFGYVTSALNAFYYGAPVFISSSFKYLIRDFQIAKPTTIFAVPMVVETIYKQIWREAKKSGNTRLLKAALKVNKGLSHVKIDLSDILFKKIKTQFGGNLKYIICGGAPLGSEYVKWFRNIGIEVLNGYGITECSPVVSVNRNFYHRDGSIGQIVRGANVEIIDGEIVVSGDIVTPCYYNDPKASSEVLVDGRYYTGDLGRIDDDGFLYITGRKKNLIILSNGENVSPEEIEAELAKDPGVAEIIASEKCNRIIVTIFPNEEYLGNEEYFDDIIYKYNVGKAKNRQIAAVFLRDKAFPRNNNGKIVRSKIDQEVNDEG